LKKNNVSIIIAAPFASGILATGANKNAKFRYKDADSEKLKKVKQLTEFCNKWNIPLKAEALQFCLRNYLVKSVIPGSIKPCEVEENVKMVSWEIPEEFWKKIEEKKLI